MATPKVPSAASLSDAIRYVNAVQNADGSLTFTVPAEIATVEGYDSSKGTSKILAQVPSGQVGPYRFQLMVYRVNR